MGSLLDARGSLVQPRPQRLTINEHAAFTEYLRKQQRRLLSLFESDHLNTELKPLRQSGRESSRIRAFPQLDKNVNVAARVSITAGA